MLYFGLPYLCIHEDWRHLNNGWKKLCFYLHVVFGLHYLCIHEDWRHLNNGWKKTTFLSSRCIRFALSLYSRRLVAPQQGTKKTAFLFSRCIRFALSSPQYALHLKHSTQELQLTLTSESYGMSGKGLCCTLLILDAQITCKNNKCFR